MSDRTRCFEPLQAIVDGAVKESCQACITIPVRNEAESLPRCLDALARQVDLHGRPMAPDSYEVLLLLNNCTDASASVARDWKQAHPSIAVHVVERSFPAERAHVGTARRLLMDTAWRRLRLHTPQTYSSALLSTDADTVVASDWLAQNLEALLQGADVVGGQVDVLPQELAALPPAVQRCYEQDRRYAQLVAELESLLDPQDGDHWPRHLDHFGSSLACTPCAYARAGGMPDVTPLEDEAFIDRVRRASLLLRHEPKVRVYTSARLEGRARVGLAGQFRLWSELPCGAAHRVQSAAFLEYRFRTMRELREIFATKELGSLRLPTAWWVNTFQEALKNETSCPGFLGAIFCNILIEESFQGEREQSIQQALDGLQERIAAAKVAEQSRLSERIFSRMKDARAAYPADVLANSVRG